MLKEEAVRQVRMNISPEYFETFDPDKQLAVINKLHSTIFHLKASEEHFPPKHMDALIDFLEGRVNDLQVIYNIKTNKKLDEFFK
ncbi:MAG: hypothetical protein KKD17_06260 [Nanoarchaeota archaeon]|nr:hypothetical protein [Nanoarchaeota archaeon]